MGEEETSRESRRCREANLTFIFNFRYVGRIVLNTVQCTVHHVRGEWSFARSLSVCLIFEIFIGWFFVVMLHILLQILTGIYTLFKLRVTKKQSWELIQPPLCNIYKKKPLFFCQIWHNKLVHANLAQNQICKCNQAFFWCTIGLLLPGYCIITVGNTSGKITPACS